MLSAKENESFCAAVAFPTISNYDPITARTGSGLLAGFWTRYDDYGPNGPYRISLDL